MSSAAGSREARAERQAKLREDARAQRHGVGANQLQAGGDGAVAGGAALNQEEHQQADANVGAEGIGPGLMNPDVAEAQPDEHAGSAQQGAAAAGSGANADAAGQSQAANNGGKDVSSTAGAANGAAPGADGGIAVTMGALREILREFRDDILSKVAANAGNSSESCLMPRAHPIVRTTDDVDFQDLTGTGGNATPTPPVTAPRTNASGNTTSQAAVSSMWRPRQLNLPGTTSLGPPMREPASTLQTASGDGGAMEGETEAREHAPLSDERFLDMDERAQAILLQLHEDGYLDPIITEKQLKYGDTMPSLPFWAVDTSDVAAGRTMSREATKELGFEELEHFANSHRVKQQFAELAAFVQRTVHDMKVIRAGVVELWNLLCIHEVSDETDLDLAEAVSLLVQTTHAWRVETLFEVQHMGHPVLDEARPQFARALYAGRTSKSTDTRTPAAQKALLQWSKSMGLTGVTAGLNALANDTLALASDTSSAATTSAKHRAASASAASFAARPAAVGSTAVARSTFREEAARAQRMAAAQAVADARAATATTTITSAATTTAAVAAATTQPGSNTSRRRRRRHGRAGNQGQFVAKGAATDGGGGTKSR